MLTFPILAYTQPLNYEVQKNDQLGTIFLSLGHKKLWPRDGKVNLFKQRIDTKIPKKIWPGQILKIEKNDILFTKNVKIENDKIIILKKIKNLKDFEEQSKIEGMVELSVNENVKLNLEESSSSNDLSTDTKDMSSNDSLVFYPAIGFFFAQDKETTSSFSTNTQTGLQPLIQVKAIYSNELYGSVSTDLLIKKIFTSQFNFPINFDYRIQLLPNVTQLSPFRVAISHSVIAHSYVGKQFNKDEQYKLTSNFIGIGFIYPMDDQWFELYFEKAYNGKIKGPRSKMNATEGFRIDSEYIFPVLDDINLIPGLNYYSLKQNNGSYKLDVYELRLTMAKEF